MVRHTSRRGNIVRYNPRPSVEPPGTARARYYSQYAAQACETQPYSLWTSFVNLCTKGVVFRTALTQSPVYVVKILHLDREELPIYERLLRESKRPNNHTAPCEVIRTGHPLLIMPDLNNAHLVHRASGSPRLVIDVLHQLVEVRNYYSKMTSALSANQAHSGNGVLT